MVKTVIIDDEPNNIVNLQAILKVHCAEINVIGEAHNAADGEILIRNTTPDLVFLDIQMPDHSGFDLLSSLPERNFEVIFVTAFDQYGIKAVKFAALDYILKPINVIELKAAVDKVIAKTDQKTKNLKLENLIRLLERNNIKQDHCIALPSLKEIRFIQPAQIVRCTAANNYTTFYLVTKEEIVVSKPIFEYEELLADYGFIRCHQSHLVNKSYIKSIVKEDGGYLLMNDTTQIPISKQKKEMLKQRLNIR